METLVMSGKERRRLEVFSRVKAGELTLVKGAELLRLGYRQAKRSYRRYREQGDAGLVHGLRSRASNHRQPELRRQAIETYRAKYGDFGPTLAAEYLAQEHKLAIPVETLRQWLVAEGLWQRRRRRAKHRRKRARREHRGELVQLDGSDHNWFEGRRGWAVLMVAIDDATGEVYARFFEEETTHASMTTLWRYIAQHGIPAAVYVDQAGIYRADREATFEEILAGKEPQTQMGRALEELGVELILARSPQAKGRVERCNGTLQDRLVKALRLQGISDLESANQFLERIFLPDFNRRFAVVPAKRTNVHRRVPVGLDLARVFTIREERTVNHDWTVRWHNRWLQLTAANQHLDLVGRRVTVCEQLDGVLHLVYQNHDLEWKEHGARPLKIRKPQRTEPTKSSQGNRPAPDHPWRRMGVGRAASGAAACSASAR
jgi:helix-turn-helix protein